MSLFGLEEATKVFLYARLTCEVPQVGCGCGNCNENPKLETQFKNKLEIAPSY